MLPFGLFQLLYGPLADRFGKLRVMGFSLIFFTMATGLTAAGVGVGRTIAALTSWHGVFIVYAIVSAAITIVLLVTARSFAAELHGDPKSLFIKPCPRLLCHGPRLRAYLVVFFEGVLVLGSTQFAEKARGTAMSLVAFSFMVGGALGTALGGRLIEATSYREFYLVGGAALVVLSTVALLAVPKQGALSEGPAHRHDLHTMRLGVVDEVGETALAEAPTSD